MDKTLAEMQIAVRETTAFYIDLASEIYKADFEMPSVLFDLRGVTAGMAYAFSWKLRFNNVLLAENYEDMIENTVPHEVAHLIARKLNPHKRIRPHGNEWKMVMLAFGRKPERCHDYDVSNARVRGGRQERIEMICSGCKRTLKVGPIQYNRWKKGASYRTRCCRAELKQADRIAA